MNTEEKAKAYDEALNRAKKELQTCGSTDCDAARQIFRFFPELRESEDERIRKELIYWLKGFIGEKEGCGYTEDEIRERIAYLEKQKETTNSFTDGVIEVRSFQRGIAEGRRLERQKEQKHPNGCFTCDEYKKGYEEGRRNGFTAGYNKAMKEVEQKEQKPAEWSEEDKEMYARVIRRYTDYEGVIMRTKEESVAAKMLDAMAQEEIWLKSLRPSWKPSEVQLMALHSVIDDESDTIGNEQLKLLYEQLKKLM